MADAGHGVSFPLDTGWTDSVDATGVHLLTDGTVRLRLEVVERPRCEDPRVVLQRFFDGLNTRVGPISVSPTASADVGDSGAPAVEYSVDYTAWNPKDGLTEHGSVDTFQRGDGLTAIYSVTAAHPGRDGLAPPQDAYNAFVHSFAHAPSVGVNAKLLPYPSARIATPVTPIAVTGLLAFTPAPGFTAGSSSTDVGTAMEHDYTFAVAWFDARADAGAAQQAEQVVASYATIRTGSVKYSTVQTLRDLGPFNHVGLSWQGNGSVGSMISGVIDIFTDPQSGHAVALIRHWNTLADATWPQRTKDTFMAQSITDTLLAIGIP
jgi:hypothetical protein